jgi:hypothetical protein
VNATQGNASSGGGCSGAGCLILFIGLVLGAIVAALISVAALIDPFDWMPSVAQVWADCEGDCELAHRFPGFWWHALANLAYIAATAPAAFAFGAFVLDLRDRRAARFESADAAAAFVDAGGAVMVSGAVLAALAALPLIVAIA